MRTMKLFDLLEESSILIPSLQRNYVHGRDDVHAKAVREHFVESLIKCCTTGEEMNLDMVYGVIKDSILVPLDGQQRLTTLWLSALYAVIKSPDGVEKRECLSKLSRFSYETRPLASTFCLWLTSGAEVSDFKAALTQAANQWGEDPTVRSIVTTLLLIDEKCSGKAKELLAAVSSKIHFEFAEVHGDPSDLYVKINARGKLLTQWENFKGEFAKQLSGETKSEFEKQVEKLSDWFFQVGGIIPDNAFFALFARLSDYELRKATNPSYDEESHPNLTVLAESKVDSKDKQELPYVPVREFDLDSRKANKLVQPFLRMVKWTLENYAALFKYWDKDNNIFQAVFLPNSADERDFSLFLYEYFQKYDNGEGLKENGYRALRLVANMFENVARNTKDDTHCKHFNRIEVLKSFLSVASDLYSPTVNLENDPYLQCVEEKQKASIYCYQDPDSTIVSMLQKCEEYLHGRVRIAILDLSKQKPIERIIDVQSNPDILLNRMQKINQQFDTWDHKTVKDRAEFFFDTIIPEYDWDIPNDVQFDFTDNGLKEVICTENDRCLQRTFVDGGESNDVEDGNQYRIPAGRDWRKSLQTLKPIILQDTINANAKKGQKKWKVKWHWASARYYLYAGGSQVTWSFPISDYRIDVFTDKAFENALKNLMKDPLTNIKDLMRINDASSVNITLKNNGLVCYFSSTSIKVKASKDDVDSKEESWTYEEFCDNISGFLQKLGELSFDDFWENGKGAMNPNRNANTTELITDIKDM